MSDKENTDVSAPIAIPSSHHLSLNDSGSHSSFRESPSIPNSPLNNVVGSPTVSESAFSPLSNQRQQQKTLESKSFPSVIFYITEQETQSPPSNSAAPEDTAAAVSHRGFAASFIIKQLISDFREGAKKKIDKLLSLDETPLLSNFPLDADQYYRNVISCLLEISQTKPCFTVIVKALILWRANTYFELNAENSNLSANATMKPKVKKADNYRLQVLEERYQQSVEYIFCSTLSSVLTHLARDNLEESVSTQLEVLCIDHFKPKQERSTLLESLLDKKQAPPNELENRKFIADMYSDILAKLSSYRMKAITSLIFRELAPSLNSALPKAMALITGVRFLKLKIKTKHSLENSLEFLTLWWGLWNKVTRPEVKQALVDTLNSILGILIETTFLTASSSPPPNITIEPALQNSQQAASTAPNYTEWANLMRKIHESNEPKRTRKSKKDMVLFPLMVSSLCLCDRDYFIQNWWSPLMEGLIRALPKLKSGALEMIHQLLEVYLARTFHSNDTSEERLHTITTTFFGKKGGLPESENLDPFVDLVSMIAKFRLEFAMKNIIFELLRGDTIVPERMIIGLRSFINIANRAEDAQKQSKTKTNEKTNNNTISIYSSANLKKKRNSIKVPTNSLDAYMPNINNYISHVFLTLDNSYGGLLQVNQTKTLNELLTKSTHGNQGIELLRICLQCIPLAYPSRYQHSELVAMLSRYLIHLDDTIKEAAFETLQRLMYSMPEIRATLIHGLTSYLLSIPDSRHTILAVLLGKLGQLMDQWREIEQTATAVTVTDPLLAELAAVTNNASATPKERERDKKQEDVAREKFGIIHKMEALAMVFLCCPSPRIRRLSIDLLKIASSLGKIWQVDKKQIRIMDIIVESGTDVINSLRQDTRYRVNFEFTDSVEELCTNAAVGTEFQTYWTCCYSELIKFFLRFCPDPVTLAWEMVCGRMGGVQPEEGNTKVNLQTEQEYYLLWWRNYIVFACAAISRKEGADTKRKSGIPVKDLFATILPVLRSNVENHRLTAVMALERVNPIAYETLFEMLKPYQAEFMKKSRLTKRKERVTLRSVISVIFCSISETMKPGTLVESETLRKTYLAHIQESLMFLNVPAMTEFIWDNLQFLRYNFCVTVRCVGQDLQNTDDLFDKSLRKDLFNLLIKWSRGQEMLKDDGNKKRLNALLAQMKDQEKYEYEKMITEHTIVLQHASCTAMAALLSGPCWDNVIDPTSKTFQWINGLLQRSEKLRRIGRTALYNLLKKNLDQPDFMKIVIKECYSGNVAVAKGYFLVLVDLFRDRDFRCPIAVLLNLIIYKSGDKGGIIRKHALQLLQLISFDMNKGLTLSNPTESDSDDNESVNEEENDQYDYPLALDSSLQDTCQRAQYNLSAKLSEHHPKFCYELFHDLVIRLNSVEPAAQKQMLTYIRPWLQKMDFTDLRSSSRMQPILENFLIVTLQHADTYPTHVQLMWTTIAQKGENITALIKFLLNLGVSKQNPHFVPLAKRIVMYIGGTNAQACIEALVGEFSSPNPELVTGSASLQNQSSGHRKSELLFDDRDPSLALDQALSAISFTTITDKVVSQFPLARGHLALILLSELSFEIPHDKFQDHLPVILQLLFLNFDNPIPTVHEHSRILLLNLIHSIAQQQPDSDIQAEAQGLEDYLKSKEGKQLWDNEDIIDVPTISSAKELATTIKKVIAVLGDNKDLSEKWANEALTWALSCPSYHLITRSFQIYRELKCVITRDAVIDVLRALWKCLATTSNNTNSPAIAVGLGLEILYTLQVMVEGLDSQKLVLFTQIFWGAVSMLHTDYELHFNEATNLLSKLITKIDFKDRAVQNVFRASIPAWNTRFLGVQPLVLKGLLSPVTEPYCIKLLAQLCLVPCDDIFHPQPTRFLANLLAVLPYLTISLNPPSNQPWNSERESPAQVAKALAQACEANSHPKLQKVLEKYQTYTDATSFLTDMRRHMRDVVSKHVVFTYTFLFHLLEYGAGHYKQALLQILFHLLQVTLESGIENALFRSKLSEWLMLVSKFISSQALWQDALQLLNVAVKLAEQPLQIDNFISPITVKNSWQEFTNLPRANTADILGKVLESCKYSEKGKSTGMEPTFWTKFFSSHELQTSPHTSNSNTIQMNGTMQFNGTVQIHSEQIGTMVMRNSPSFDEEEDVDEYSDDDDIGSIREPRVPASAVSFSDSTAKFKRKFQQPIAFQFPSFHGFEDLLDFEAEEPETDDSNNNYPTNNADDD